MSRSRWQELLVVGSFSCSLAVLLLGNTKYGNLRDAYDDHIHYAYFAWVFLHHGLRVYTEPNWLAAGGVTYPLEHLARWGWNDLPVVHPPGVFLVFLPVALVGRYSAMGSHAFFVLTTAYVLMLAHLAVLASFRALTVSSPGSRILAAGLAWGVLVHLGLDGFFDVVWIGSGAMMACSLTKGRPRAALRWFAFAALIQYRALVLLPLAALATWRAARQDRRWPVAELACAGASGVIAVLTFVMMYPVTAQFRAAHDGLAAHAGDPFLWTTLAIGTAGIVAGLAARDLVLTAMIAIASASAVADLPLYRGYWHHASIMLPVILGVGIATARSRVPLARQLTIAWAVALASTVWFAGREASLVYEFAGSFHPTL